MEEFGGKAADSGTQTKGSIACTRVKIHRKHIWGDTHAQKLQVTNSSRSLIKESLSSFWGGGGEEEKKKAMRSSVKKIKSKTTFLQTSVQTGYQWITLQLGMLPLIFCNRRYH